MRAVLWIALSLVTATVMTAAPAMARTFDRLVIAGDSLSDDGNIFAITSAIPFVEPFPDNPPYATGRFSNGPVWTEYLARGLGFEAGDVANLALGGARTAGHVIIDEAPGFLRDGLRASGIGGVKQQVDVYIASGRPVSAQGLYVIWGGANDYLGGAATVGANGTPSPVTNLVGAIDDFADAGARTFLIPNLPDLGQTPSALRDEGRSSALTAASAAHNTALAVALAELRDDRGLEIFELDVETYFATAASFGFANVTQPCQDPAVSCDGALFFDGLHPTTAAHAQLGALAEATVVPLPGALVLMASALAGLAAIRHGRRPRGARAAPR